MIPHTLTPGPRNLEPLAQALREAALTEMPTDDWAVLALTKALADTVAAGANSQGLTADEAYDRISGALMLLVQEACEAASSDKPGH